MLKSLFHFFRRSTLNDSIPFKPLFKEQTNNDLLESEGYVVLNTLPASVIDALNSLYSENQVENIDKGFYSSINDYPKELKKHISDEIQRLVIPSLSPFLSGHEFLAASFMVKKNNDTGEVHLHQDWSIVDERNSHSYNVWIPLCDVNELNGCLSVVPKSHRFLKNIRGLGIDPCYQAISAELSELLVPLPMKTGQVVVYNYRLLHASKINQGDRSRVAIVLGLKVPEADMLLYRNEGNKGIHAYKINPDFFLNENIMSTEFEVRPFKTIFPKTKKMNHRDLKLIKQHYFA